MHKFRNGSLLPILLLATVWGSHAFGAVSPIEDPGWIPIEPSANSADVSPKFGYRISKLRSARLHALHRQAKSTTTTPAPSTTTLSILTTTSETLVPKTRKPHSEKSNASSQPKQQQRPPRQQPFLVYTTSTTTPVPDDEETKSLSQQVKDGKYGLIQNELFSAQPSRPGIISYVDNNEVPKDNSGNLGGLNQEEIWLSEGHVLVLSGHDSKDDGAWEPIDNYQAPPRQVKLPANPSVAPPFPVQLRDGGPTGFVATKNGTNPALQRFAQQQGNLFLGNGIFPQQPFPPSFLPPPPPLDPNKPLDEDDPSIYYPPPYDFSFHGDNSTELPPGPLVPGIILPPPPEFFAPLNKTSKPNFVVPGQAEPPDLGSIPHRPFRPRPTPSRPSFAQYPLSVTTKPPPTTTTTTSEPNVDNEIYAPEYPQKEPNVILHHHGSPILYSPDPIYLRNITFVSPPQQVFVYEVPPAAPSLRKLPKQNTFVSSTPSPTILYYTLPPDRGVQISVHTTASTVEDRRPKYYETTPAPKVVSREFFNAERQKTNYITSTPKPFVSTERPRVVSQEYFPTNKPIPSTTPAYLVTQTPKYNIGPVYVEDSFQPSYEYPYKLRSTTPAPQTQYRDRPKDDYGPPNFVSGPRINQQTLDLISLLKSDLYIQRRPVIPTVAPPYNPHRDYFPNRQFYRQPSKDVRSTTQNPIFNGLYTQDDAKYMDDNTKSLFDDFGQRVPSTTPIPLQSAGQVQLHDDIRVNYRQPLPAINPDSEFINLRDQSYVSYQLPGQGRRGSSHYYYISPRAPRGTSEHSKKSSSPK
ncbi:uncharacterized protein LOC132201031 [Neocloeon triangulifer]|uniref:uncharacterized protein LOC132201031 n=1 Tax=Neocloeon triangulifer TaxID=2078957 RepID=UPI00286F4B46|nr:uncharacterized protein LOC132201031 [Neocloeon triangulifer]